MGTRALRNTLLLLLTRVVSRVIALVSVITIGNALGDTRFGEMQTAVTYVNLVGTITDLGLSALYVREGARQVAALGRFFNNIASVKLLLSAVSLPPLLAVLYFAGLRSLLLPSFAILVLSGYTLLLRNTLYAMQQLRFEIIEIIPETLIVLGLALLGAHLGADAGYYLWAYAASYAFALVYFSIVLYRKGVLRPQWTVDMTMLRPWVRAAVPLGITFVITTVYFKVDVPILQRFRPYDEVGWYTFAYKPFESLLFIPFSLRGVVFPLLAVYHARSPQRVLALSEKFFKALVMLGWPISVGVFLLAPQFNDLLHLYPQSAPALQILALAIVFMFADNTFAATLNAIDKQNVFAGVAMVGLVVNVAVNFVVIPPLRVPRRQLGGGGDGSRIGCRRLVCPARPAGRHPDRALLLEDDRGRRAHGRVPVFRAAARTSHALRSGDRRSGHLRRRPGGAARCRRRGDQADSQRAAVAQWLIRSVVASTLTLWRSRRAQSPAEPAGPSPRW